MRACSGLGSCSTSTHHRNCSEHASYAVRHIVSAFSSGRARCTRLAKATGGGLRRPHGADGFPSSGCIDAREPDRCAKRPADSLGSADSPCIDLSRRRTVASSELCKTHQSVGRHCREFPHADSTIRPPPRFTGAAVQYCWILVRPAAAAAAVVESFHALDAGESK